MFCSHCGAVIADDAQFCPQCGAQHAEPEPSAAGQESTVEDPQNIAKRTRDLKHLCAILWIVVGIIQILSCVGIIAGVWNIVIGAKGLKAAENIWPGNRAAYAAFDADLNSLTIGLILNIVLGLGLGVWISIIEFFLRDRILKNKSVFGM